MSISRALLAAVAFLAGIGAAAAQPPRPQPAAGTVTLTLSEYGRLLDLAERPELPPDPPPIAAVLARGELRIRVADERATGTFTLEGEVFRTGVTKVPLVRDATLIDARLGNEPLPLLRENQTAVALVSGPRSYSIALDWGAPLDLAPGRASFTVPVPPAGSVSAVFELPGAPADVRVEPGAITGTTAAGTLTRVEATLVPGSRTRVSWSSRQTGTPPAARELRALADVKTLISVGEADVRMTTLLDITVLRGMAERLELKLPAGFAVTAASGGGLERADEQPGLLVLTLRNPAERRHQVLVSLEKSAADTRRLETAVPMLLAAERETGEIAVEAVGTMELTAHESDVLRRIDVREASAPLRSLARLPLLAALRYHRRAPEPPAVALDVVRFPDAPVIAAVADRATVTTLLTSEGRTLTEIALVMRNRAQPYVRVDLPADATMISAEVAGESVKLAHGSDGVRVPLLRPGFRPNGPYTVSFVYLHNGQPFARKGRAELTLPRMDVPVAVVTWEMFVPDRYRVKDFDGNALPMPAVPGGGVVGGVVGGVPEPPGGGTGVGSGVSVGGGGTAAPRPGQIAGVVTDDMGTALPGTTVAAVRDDRVVAMAVSDDRGRYLLAGLPAGPLTVTARLEGFAERRADVRLDSRSGRVVHFRLPIGRSGESVRLEIAGEDGDARGRAQAPSQNVFNLQRRVTGVLPVRIEVPRAGSAYRFARPLVLDETTTVSFEYRVR